MMQHANHHKFSLRKKLQEIWTNRWSGVVLTTTCVVAAAFLVYRIPAPGVSAGVLAVVSVLVSLRTKSTGTEKAVWVLVILAFLAVELSAIKKDRRETAMEQERHINEERIHFAEVQEKMKSGFEDATKTETGGDSYCYLQEPFPTAGVMVGCYGKYPVYDLEVWAFDPNNKANQWNEKIGTMAVKTFKAFAHPLPFSGADKQAFTVTFSARNGFTTELIRYRKLGDAWVSAKILCRYSAPGQGIVLMRMIDNGFPTDELTQDQEWMQMQRLPSQGEPVPSS